MEKIIGHGSVTYAAIEETAMWNGGKTMRLVVRTTLVLNPEASGYDRAAYGQLMDEIKAYMDRHPEIDATDIDGA